MSESFESQERIQHWINGHGDPLPFSQVSLLPDADKLDAALARIEQIRQAGEELSYQDTIDRVSRESGVSAKIAEVALYAVLDR